MRVVITPQARADLTEIWNWNASERGIRDADRYLAFLGKHIGGLSKTYARGRPVEVRPEYRYVLIQRRSRGHGHIAVYEVADNKVNILRVYHTSQNWQDRLSDEP